MGHCLRQKISPECWTDKANVKSMSEHSTINHVDVSVSSPVDNLYSRTLEYKPLIWNAMSQTAVLHLPYMALSTLRHGS